MFSLKPYRARPSAWLVLLTCFFTLTLADTPTQANHLGITQESNIARVTGIAQGQVVSGILQVQTHVNGMTDGADYDVRYQIDGPSGYINTARGAPFVLSGGRWDTTRSEPGDYQLNAFFIRNHRVIDFRRIKFTVVRPLVIESISGVQQNGVLTGSAIVQAKIQGGTPSRVTFDIAGPSQFSAVAYEPPYVMLDEGQAWDVSQMPEGRYTLTVTAYRGDHADDSKSVSFQIGQSQQEDLPSLIEQPDDRGDHGPLPDATARGFLGINLAEVTYYTREWVFADAMKRARPWLPTRSGGSNPWDSGETLELNAQGWPILRNGQAAHTITLNDMDGAYPAGRYVCTYDGDGEVVLDFDARVVRRSSNRLEVDVTPSSSGIYLRIDKSDPTNPVRNVRLWLPGLESADSAFHPFYLSRLQPFSVLRFMDWARVNGSSASNWSDRPTDDYYTQATGKGVAIELMIDLCNELGADPWFSMPHRASDSYVREFARLVKSRLRPDLNVYIEWSNEVWNSQFPQHTWVRDRGDGRSLSQAFISAWAKEADRDFDIWREVFDEQADRVIRVAASQKDNPWITEKLTEALDGEFDAISCSTYFTLTRDQRSRLGSSTTASDILNMALSELTRSVRSHYRAHGELARKWSDKLDRNIPLVSYEGGQHYTANGGNPPWARAFLDVQKHPRMYDTYLANLREWENAGGSLFVAYNFVDKPDKWGAWGLLDFMDQSIDKAPKYRALIDYKPNNRPN
jgi:hypothetical protein